MERRRFLSLTSGVCATSVGAAGLGGLPTAVDTDGELFRALSEAIYAMPAFNNHLHIEGARESLNWFFPARVVGRTEAGSRGLGEGLARLVDMAPEDIGPDSVDTVRRRYAEFCEARGPRDYYHRLADETNTSHIAFIAEPYDTQNDTLVSDRLKLVVHVDQYLFPLDNAPLGAASPSHKIYLGMRDRAWRAEEERLGPRPQGFADFLAWVRGAMEAQLEMPGVIGGKWGLAYWRTLEFLPVDYAEAARIYETRDNTPASYRKLQDFLAAHVLTLCGELGLPLQIHTGLGASPGLVLADSNPALLDRVLSRPEVTEARVMGLHGGYPFCDEMGVVSRRPNVWLDFSWMVLLLPPQILAGYLRAWIALGSPYRLLFGVDGAGLAQVVGTWCARRALALAMTSLVQEEEYTEDEVLGFARAVLHDNAMKVYDARL